MIEEQGNAIRYGWIEGSKGDTPEALRANGYHREIDEDDVIKQLHDDAARSLPPGTRYEIRKAMSWNFGRSHAMAWYSTPDMAVDHQWGDVALGFRPDLGATIVGRFVTPAAVAS